MRKHTRNITEIEAQTIVISFSSCASQDYDLHFSERGERGRMMMAELKSSFQLSNKKHGKLSLYSKFE